MKDTSPLAFDVERLEGTTCPPTTSDSGRLSASSRHVCLKDGRDTCVGGSEAEDLLLDPEPLSHEARYPLFGGGGSRAGGGKRQESPTRANFQRAPQNAAVRQTVFECEI